MPKKSIDPRLHPYLKASMDWRPEEHSAVIGPDDDARRRVFTGAIYESRLDEIITNASLREDSRRPKSEHELEIELAKNELAAGRKPDDQRPISNYTTYELKGRHRIGNMRVAHFIRYMRSLFVRCAPLLISMDGQGYHFGVRLVGKDIDSATGRQRYVNAKLITQSVEQKNLFGYSRDEVTEIVAQFNGLLIPRSAVNPNYVEPELVYRPRPGEKDPSGSHVRDNGTKFKGMLPHTMAIVLSQLDRTVNDHNYGDYVDGPDAQSLWTKPVDKAGLFLMQGRANQASYVVKDVYDIAIYVLFSSKVMKIVGWAGMPYMHANFPKLNFIAGDHENKVPKGVTWLCTPIASQMLLPYELLLNQLAGYDPEWLEKTGLLEIR